MITLKRFRRLETVLRRVGYGDDFERSENVAPPTTADDFASRAIYVICNSGMKNRIATGIHKKCMARLLSGRSVGNAFGHVGKRKAINMIWRTRESLFDDYLVQFEPLDFLETLPWIGPVTKFHLAKNLGEDVAKPDVHLERLARYEATTTAQLCQRLSRQTGYRIATVDTILWQACADGVLNSRTYEIHGWRKAFNSHALDEWAE